MSAPFRDGLALQCSLGCVVPLLSCVMRVVMCGLVDGKEEIKVNTYSCTGLSG